MIFPATTALFAALLALVYVGLSIWVIVGRTSENTLIGDGDDALRRRIRAHANFGEYVPLALILLALLEAGGAGRGFCVTMGLVLLVGRVLHPIGLFAPPNSPRQFACRGGGILATILVLGVSAVTLLVRLA